MPSIKTKSKSQLDKELRAQLRHDPTYRVSQKLLCAGNYFSFCSRDIDDLVLELPEKERNEVQEVLGLLEFICEYATSLELHARERINAEGGQG